MPSYLTAQGPRKPLWASIARRHVEIVCLGFLKQKHFGKSQKDKFSKKKEIFGKYH